MGHTLQENAKRSGSSFYVKANNVKLLVLHLLSVWYPDSTALQESGSETAVWCLL